MIKWLQNQFYKILLFACLINIAINTGLVNKKKKPAEPLMEFHLPQKILFMLPL